LPYYLGAKKTDWVRPEKIADLFEKNEYRKFVDDYKDYKKNLDDIKLELANH
jgi:hypothetical protein